MPVLKRTYATTKVSIIQTEQVMVRNIYVCTYICSNIDYEKSKKVFKGGFGGRTGKGELI